MKKNLALPHFTFTYCDGRADIDTGEENLQASPKQRII